MALTAWDKWVFVFPEEIILATCPVLVIMNDRNNIIYQDNITWCHNGHGGIWNHQPHNCLLKRLFGHRSKKASKLRFTGLCVGNSPVTGEFPTQMASYLKMFPFDDVIMLNPYNGCWCPSSLHHLAIGDNGIDYIEHYSIHVSGWLLKWLSLITAHGSVSNGPGSVTWLATKYLKTVSWRNDTEKLTTLWPQNISFWPKINISSSYFTILMLNCLENTLKLQFDSYVTLVNSQTTWLDLIPTLLESDLDSRLKYSKITHRYATDYPFTRFLYWELSIDTNFIHFICQFHQTVA